MQLPELSALDSTGTDNWVGPFNIVVMATLRLVYYAWSGSYIHNEGGGGGTYRREMLTRRREAGRCGDGQTKTILVQSTTDESSLQRGNVRNYGNF